MSKQINDLLDIYNDPKLTSKEREHCLFYHCVFVLLFRLLLVFQCITIYETIPNKNNQ